MMYDRLKSLSMWGNMLSVNSGNNHTSISYLSSITTITSDHTDDLRTYLFTQLQGQNKIRTDVFFKVSAANRKHKYSIFSIQMATLQPIFENRCPTFVISARGKFGNIISRSISFDPHDFSKIIDSM